MHVMKFSTNVGTADVLFTGFVVCVCLILLNVASTWTPQGTRLRLQSTLALKNPLVLGVVQIQNKETLLNDEKCPVNVMKIKTFQKSCYVFMLPLVEWAALK